MRVVFDEGEKCNKNSLNEHLRKGPDLLKNLVSILMRFYLGEFAVVGDIEQMFHRLKVRETDKDALRFT